MNNKYIVTFKHPLVRPGIEIQTESSEKYLVAVIKMGLDKIRELNADKPKEPPDEKG